MEGSKLLINEPPLQVLPTLAKSIDVNKAIILQQVQYWIATSGHEINGERWVYNSYTEWSRQFPWLTPRAVRWHIKGLEETGLLISGEFNSDARDHTKWYRIDYKKLNELVTVASCGMSISVTPHVNRRQMQETDVAISSLLTENTTENTSRETKKSITESFEQYRDNLKERFPEIDFEAELEKFELYWRDGKRQLKRPKLALLNWMTKAEQYRKERGNGAHRGDSQEDRSARRTASIGAPILGRRG